MEEKTETNFLFDVQDQNQESGSEREVYFRRISEVYRIYNPAKYKATDFSLEKFLGGIPDHRLQELYEKICRKYSVKPKPAYVCKKTPPPTTPEKEKKENDDIKDPFSFIGGATGTDPFAGASFSSDGKNF